MCGIVGYIGNKEAYPILIKGLHRLEYRGYDSAGIALVNAGHVNVYKKSGRVAALETYIQGKDTTGKTGIGHTRWATHGAPSDVNAHPHSSEDGRFILIHNGIIENYLSLKKILLTHGFQFRSETDSEVLVQYIDYMSQLHPSESAENLVSRALKDVIGTYGILLIDTKMPDTIIAARKGSPLVIGVGEDGYYLASDVSPIIEYTNDVIYLDDGQMAVVHARDLVLKDLNDHIYTPKISKIDLCVNAVDKGNYDHFMLKEIFEQPNTIADCCRGRIDKTHQRIVLQGVEMLKDHFLNAKRIIIIACGTSWHAGLVAEYMIEELCRIPVEVEYASEFRYRNPVLNKDEDIIIAISQSGETADTLEAMETAKRQGCKIFGIVNVVGSSIARLADAGAYTHVGIEIGVASTKAFTGQLTVLLLLAIKIAILKKTIAQQRLEQLTGALNILPEMVTKVLTQSPKLQSIAKKYGAAKNRLFLGRGINFPIALEGALKIKEVSYIPAEGYPAAEMKHGPIALIDRNTPTFIIATQHAQYKKTISNIQEIKARHGAVIAIATEGDGQITALADDVVLVPDVDEILSPIVNVVCWQLLAYYTGMFLLRDIDKPRNLAKSVTVE